MTHIHRRFLAAILLAGSLCLSASDTRAADLPGGAYSGTVDFGPVLLDGRYPLTVGQSSPGMVDVTTSVTGALSARVTFAAQTEEAVGKVSVRDKQIRLTLRGKVDEGRVGIVATLEGSAFVGTVTLRGKTSPCRMEVSSVGPLRARYELSLACAANGTVTGAGTLTVGRESIAVTLRGKARKQRLTLAIKAGTTQLKITGAEIAEGSVYAPNWKAKGFGALVKGRRRLVLAPQ